MEMQGGHSGFRDETSSWEEGASYLSMLIAFVQTCFPSLMLFDWL